MMVKALRRGIVHAAHIDDNIQLLQHLGVPAAHHLCVPEPRRLPASPNAETQCLLAGGPVRLLLLLRLCALYTRPLDVSGMPYASGLSAM